MSLSPPKKLKGTKKKKEIKKSVVDHTYREYSQARISDLVDDYDGTNEELFPSKLHKILSTHEYSHIISWRPHGRAWAVMNKSLFSSVILPKYFNHDKFESFNRSVNGWGFKRLSRDGPDKNSYYHELFLRNRPDLTRAMTRLVRPGKRLPNKAGEPDFYDISRKYPLAYPATTPSSEVEEADTGDKRTPSPIFTPPATKHAKEGSQHSPQVQGICPPYDHGRPHGVHMPYTKNPPSSQPRGYSQPLPPYSQPPPYSEPPPNYGPPQHTPSAIFTPPATKRAKTNVSQHPPQQVQGIYSPYGYAHPHGVPMPYMQIPPYSQPRGYAQPSPYSLPPPYSEPPNYGPPPGGVYHAPPGQFYHQQSQPSTSPMGPPNVQFHHQNLWGPAGMPPREWHSSTPYHHHYHPPAHGTAQHYEEYIPAILHTNQNGHSNRGYATHIGQTIAERNQNHEIREGKSTAQDCPKSDPEHAPGVPNQPHLEGSPQFSEGPELRSATMQQPRIKDEPHSDEMSSMAPAPEQFNVRVDDQGRNAEEEHNPLDIDNFYDPPHPKPTVEKELVIYPSPQKGSPSQKGSECEKGSPEHANVPPNISLGYLKSQGN